MTNSYRKRTRQVLVSSRWISTHLAFLKFFIRYPIVMIFPALLTLWAAPVFAQDARLKAGAPMLVSPGNGTQLADAADAVILEADTTGAAALFVPAVLDYRFEVYDATRRTQFASSLGAEERGMATYRLSGLLAYETVYRWRVRAEFNDAAGPWSESWSFETGPAPAPVGKLGFTDVTISSGLGGPPRVPLGGHGAAFADATGDGRPDLYITNHLDGPVADQFFVNHGGRMFVESGGVRGIADFDMGSHGAVWGDLDNDGDFDLVNGTTGFRGEPNNVYRNRGDGVFSDVTPPAIRARREATRGVALFDMDRDGDLDIFAVTGWRGDGDPPGERNELYRNDGGMRFAAIESGAAYGARAGQGVTDTDYDGDGDVDLITGNRDGDLVILSNDGAGNFRRVDPGAIGISHRAYGGVTTGDVDADGDFDMLLVDAEDVGHLYRNVGAGRFVHLRDFSDVDGFMGGFADLDNDGDLDLVFAGDDMVYLNDGRGRFSAGPSVPVNGIRDPRAIGFADIDADGDLDFAVGVKYSRNWLVRNDFNGGYWLKIRLRSPRGQAGAFGAKVSVYAAGAAGNSPIAVRESRSANGYLGQDDPVLHVGLGGRRRVDVMVTFLNGMTRVLTNVAANRTVMIDGADGGPAPVLVRPYRGEGR